MVFANSHRREKKQSTHWRVLLFLLIFIILNCLAVSAQAITDITVQKVWNDENNNDHYRDQACVQLEYGGQPSCYQTVFPGTSNTEQFTFTEMISEQTWSAAEIGTVCVDGPVLPHEYIQLEWIESTGTQYIDTGVTAGSETYFEVEFITYNPLSSSSSGAILGSRTASEVQDYSLATYSPTQNLYMGVFYNTGITRDARNYIGAYNANLTTGIKQTCSYRNGIYTDPSGNTIIATLSEPYENQANIYVFAKNYLDKNAADELGLVRLYDLNLWKGNDLVRNFVPCYRLSDGEIGLYDTVNDVFYTNQGTGEFIKGPSVGWSGVVCPDMYDLGTIHRGRYLQVEYLEAPIGINNEINTGYYPNEKTKADMVFEPLSDPIPAGTGWASYFVFFARQNTDDREAFGFVDAANLDTYMYFYHPGAGSISNTDKSYIVNTQKTITKNIKQQVVLGPTSFVWTNLIGNSVIYQTNQISNSTAFTATGPLVILNDHGLGIRMYSMAISEISGSTETVVKNYVPVYDLMTNTYGLFDTKNNEFISGTGSFSGPAI